MSKEDLLIALLKSNKSHIELQRSEDNNTEIGEIKKIFNEFRRRRRNVHYIEEIGEYLKELEQKDSLTKQEKKRYAKSLQKAEEYFKKLKEDLNRLEKHQYNDKEDLDYKGIRQT